MTSKTSLISDPLNPSVSNYSDTENVPSAYSIQTRTPLPSILKKPNAEKPSATPGEPSSFKTTRIVVPDAAVHKAKATLTLATAATAVTSRDHPPQKAGRKKPMFVASTSALSKRRPVVIRRKSAQTSPSAEVSEDSLFKPEPAPATTKADGPAQKPAISEGKFVQHLVYGYGSKLIFNRTRQRRPGTLLAVTIISTTRWRKQQQQYK